MYSTCSQDTTPTHTRMCIYICIYSLIYIRAHICIQRVFTRLKLSERAQARASKKRTGRPYYIYIYYVHKHIYIYVYIYMRVTYMYTITHTHSHTQAGAKSTRAHTEQDWVTQNAERETREVRCLLGSCHI